jgi:hypothetical protein
MEVDGYVFGQSRIDLSSHPDLLPRLLAFKRRAADLTKYVKEQKWGRVNIHVDRIDQQRPKIDGNIPGDAVLEGLYRRFRFFILNDEPANYRRFVRLLSAASDDEVLQRHLRIERKEFHKSHSLEFGFASAPRTYRPEEVIDFWFNAYYFHDDEPQREQLAAFESIVSAQGAKVVLWEAVWHSVLKIRDMALLVKDTAAETPMVYVPLYFKTPRFA